MLEISKGIKNLPHLHSLDLDLASCPGLSDHGMMYLADVLKTFSGLRQLKLNFDGFQGDMEGLRSLQDGLEKLGSLKVL